MMNELDELIFYTEKIGIDIDKSKAQKLVEFNSILKEILKGRSFISKNDKDKILSKHIPDSLYVLKCFNHNPQKIIDIGTGIGFPGIILAIILTDTKFTLVDNSGLKVKYLKNIVQTLELSNTKVICENCEKLAKDKIYREKFDIALTRALGKLPIITELCTPFLKIGGIFYAYKSGNIENELNISKEHIKKLGCKIKDIFPYTLDDTFERNILSIQKISKTSDIFPRSKHLIKKEFSD